MRKAVKFSLITLLWNGGKACHKHFTANSRLSASARSSVVKITLTRGMKTAARALELLLCLFVIGIGSASDCLNEYNLMLQQKSLSQFEQYCCTSANNGKSFSFPLSGGFTKYISCSSEPPSSCPSK